MENHSLNLCKDEINISKFIEISTSLCIFNSYLVVVCECIVTLKVAVQLPVAWLWGFGFVFSFFPFPVQMISIFDRS